MQVKIEIGCGRCKRVEEKTVSLEEAQRIESTAVERLKLAEELPGLLNSQLNQKHPDLIVMYRAPGTEAYDVKSMSNLCSSPDAKRNKGCEARVISLLHEISLQLPKPVKPKKEPGSKPQKNENKKKNGQEA